MNWAAHVEWKMGTGSEPSQTSNPWKNAAGSVPVPFFHGASASPPEEWGQAPSAIRITTATPVVDGASPHFRAPVFAARVSPYPENRRSNP